MSLVLLTFVLTGVVFCEPNSAEQNGIFVDYLQSFDGFSNDTIEYFEKDVDQLILLLGYPVENIEKKLSMKVLLLATYLQSIKISNSNNFNMKLVSFESIRVEGDGLLNDFKQLLEKMNELGNCISKVQSALFKAYTDLAPEDATFVVQMVNNRFNLTDPDFIRWLSANSF